MSKSTIRNLIIAVLLTLGSAAVFSAMIYYVNSQGAKLVEQIGSLEEQRRQEVALTTLQKISEQTKNERAELQGYFLLKESDSIDFLNTIETLAPEVGVVLQTDGLSLAKDPAWIDVGFSFSGSRTNVENFIQVLENVPYVSRVLSIDVKAVSGAKWEASVKMQVHVLSYDE